MGLVCFADRCNARIRLGFPKPELFALLLDFASRLDILNPELGTVLCSSRGSSSLTALKMRLKKDLTAVNGRLKVFIVRFSPLTIEGAVGTFCRTPLRLHEGVVDASGDNGIVNDDVEEERGFYEYGRTEVE